MGFGYVISGTTKDGFHVHSGIEGFSYTDPTGVLGCSSCQVGDTARPATPTRSAIRRRACSKSPSGTPPSTAASSDTNGNGLPGPKQPEWDQDGDGRPDGFYSANNPAELGPSLARFLDVIAATTSSASVAINSVTLQTDTQIYQARFDSNDWSGDLSPFPERRTEALADPVWHGRDEVTAQAERDATAHHYHHTSAEDPADRHGVPFRWDDIADAAAGLAAAGLRSCPLATTRLARTCSTTFAASDDDEVQNGGAFRNREYVLGDIVNSEPAYVGPPRSYLPGQSRDRRGTAPSPTPHADRDHRPLCRRQRRHAARVRRDDGRRRAVRLRAPRRLSQPCRA